MTGAAILAQMQDGINYTHSLQSLAKEKNPYACYEIGEMEYTGQMTGYPRYIKSYEYFKIAAEKNHPRACWLIAQMIYQKKIGDLSKDDLEEYKINPEKFKLHYIYREF